MTCPDQHARFAACLILIAAAIASDLVRLIF